MPLPSLYFVDGLSTLLALSQIIHLAFEEKEFSLALISSFGEGSGAGREKHEWERSNAPNRNQ